MNSTNVQTELKDGKFEFQVLRRPQYHSLLQDYLGIETGKAGRLNHSRSERRIGYSHSSIEGGEL